MRLRAVVGENEHDLRASADAFAVLDQIVASRLRRRLTTVIDSLGLDAALRAAWRQLGSCGRRAVHRRCVRHCRRGVPATQRRSTGRRARRRRRQPAAPLAVDSRRGCCRAVGSDLHHAGAGRGRAGGVGDTSPIGRRRAGGRHRQPTRDGDQRRAAPVELRLARWTRAAWRRTCARSPSTPRRPASTTSG